MTLKMGFKVNMTSFRSQKLWFGHLALYYDYYVTPWINSLWMSSAERDSYQSESSGTENLSDIWIDDGEEKKQELNENLVCCLHLNQKHQFPVWRAALYSLVILGWKKRWSRKLLTEPQIWAGEPSSKK